MMSTVGRALAAACLLCLPFVPLTAAAADGEWGTVEGQFVLEGDAPELAPLVAKGDATAKDAQVCAALGVPNESLVVNPENRGIANIFLYLRKAPGRIHPDLAQSSQKEIDFDQKDCRFIPHAMIVRTDQTVLLKSSDPISHNTRTSSFENTAINLIIPPNDRKGTPIQLKKSEVSRPPVTVSCDIHTYMRAYWVVTDHPYVALTDADGKFRIENLPAGEHTFRVWHERAKYVQADTFKWDLKVTVKGGETITLPPITLQAEIFNKDP